MFNEKANREYIETQFEIREEIEKLLSYLDSHNQAVNINWGHVGDMKYILTQIKQLNGNGEDE